MPKRKGTAEWNGKFQDGKGIVLAITKITFKGRSLHYRSECFGSEYPYDLYNLYLLKEGIEI